MTRGGVDLARILTKGGVVVIVVVVVVVVRIADRLGGGSELVRVRIASAGSVVDRTAGQKIYRV